MLAMRQKAWVWLLLGLLFSTGTEILQYLSPPCPGRDFCFYGTLLPIPVRLLYLQGNSGIWKEYKAFQRWTTYEKVLQATCN